MALKFRRGTTAQKSGSLAFGEPYVNTTLGTLQIGGDNGDITLLINSSSQGISGSSLDITGNAKIDGNLTLGGNITIGDNTSDTVTVTANLSSSLIPSVTNTFDLGSSDKIWRDLYLSTGSIKLVDGSGAIVNTITNANIVTTDSISSGSVNLTSSLPTGSVSGSSQITLQNTTGFTAFNTALAAITGSLISSASADRISITNINTTTASLNTSVSNINSFSSSQLTQNTALATITGSLIVTASNNVTSITNLNSFTSSINTTIKSKLDTDGVISGSSQVTLSSTTGFSTYSTSVDSRITTEKGRIDAILASADANYDTFAEIVTLINSVDTTNDNAFASFYTASVGRLNNLESTSASVETRLTEIGVVSGSLIATASNHEQRLDTFESISGSFAKTNESNTFGNDQIISGNISLTGRVTAGLAISGSGLNINKSDGQVVIQLANSTNGRGFDLHSYNGDSFAIHGANNQTVFRIDSGSQFDSHFFGDVFILSGSVLSSGGFTGSIAATNGVVSGSSQVIGILSSLNTYTGSNDTTNTTQNNRLTALEASASTALSTNNTQDVSISNLNTFSGSQLSKDSTLATYTASVDTRLIEIGVVSGSLITSASAAKTTNDSQDVSITNLNSYTSSLNNAIQLTGSTVSFLGNIVVYGTQSVINSQNVEISDNILYLAPTASIDNDLGVVGHYNDGTYRHAGIFMDASDGHAWKVFNGLTQETIGTVDTAGTGFTLADFKAGAITGTSLNGTINATNGVVSGSSQINLASVTGNSTSNVSEGSNLYYTDARVKTKLDAEGVISSSAQLTTTFDSRYLNTGGDGVFSGSSQIPNSSITNAQLANNYIQIAGYNIGLGTAIGAATIGNAIGAFSGSSQVDLTATTNYASGILTRLNAVGVVSGSSQIAFSGVTGTVSNAQLANSTISGISLGSNLAALTIGTGLSGTSYNGSGAVTITNTGVLSNAAGSGISVSGATGAVTITNSGVRSIAAGTGVSVSATTGDNCSISIGQSVATSASPTFAGLTINGAITATGDITAYFTSDKRHKNSIKVIPNALQKVSKLNGVTWEWNEDVNEVTKSTPKTGLIAQEVQEVLPEVVREREDGFLSLDYSKMMGLLVEAIKEQQTHIHNLTLQIEELKKQKGL